MKTLLLSLLALTASLSAQAAGLNLTDPCAPIARAMDSRMYCEAGKGVGAEVVFTTYMSVVSEACPAANFVELSYATITLNKEGKPPRTIKLNSGEYESSRSGEYGEAWLTSRKEKLNLRHCVMPMMGGVSIGN